MRDSVNTNNTAAQQAVSVPRVDRAQAKKTQRVAASVQPLAVPSAPQRRVPISVSHSEMLMAEAVDGDNSEAIGVGASGRRAVGQAIDDPRGQAVLDVASREVRSEPVPGPSNSYDQDSGADQSTASTENAAPPRKAAVSASAGTHADTTVQSDVQEQLLLETSTMQRFEVGTLCGAKLINELEHTFFKSDWNPQFNQLKSAMQDQMQRLQMVMR